MVGNALGLPLLGLDVEFTGRGITDGLVDVVAGVRLPLTRLPLFNFCSLFLIKVISDLSRITKFGLSCD